MPDAITLQCQTYWLTTIATECDWRQSDDQTRAWWWCPICEQWHDPLAPGEQGEALRTELAAQNTNRDRPDCIPDEWLEEDIDDAF